MPIFNIAIIAFDDVDPAISTSETVGITGTFTIAAGATQIPIRVDDDDDEFDDGFIDPPGNSTANNNQLLADPVTVNGTTFAAGSQIELEFSVTTTDGDTFFIVRIDGVNVGLASPDALPTDGLTFTVDSSDDGQETPYDTIFCFAAGTHIATPEGERLIETLRAGDWVSLYNGPTAMVRWVGIRHFSPSALRLDPDLRPIRIKRGALGNARDLYVSPQHRMLLTDWRASLMFGEQEVLAPAKSLLNDDTIQQVCPADGITYVHLLFDRHEIVSAEGIPSESFHPGEVVVSTLDDTTRNELLRLFPELEDGMMTNRPPARRILRPFEARALMAS
ncbi:MAG: Hint domain-containing protein [Pseudomonadota bacterium]